ncbi:hypothetical protein ACFY0G_02400 [Streptomyces sp. NPDC001552]|uniref:hypothetical protein n=1 Tax=Streptomyces sp. NPDC001552 TaxID=3364587 RepID=UPI0036B5F646
MSVAPVRPTCEFPFPTGHPLVRTARFRCPHGCDWYRDESTDLGPSGVTAVTGQEPGARVAAFWARVNGAIEEHVAEAHPEAGQPEQ